MYVSNTSQLWHTHIAVYQQVAVLSRLVVTSNKQPHYQVVQLRDMLFWQLTTTEALKDVGTTTNTIATQVYMCYVSFHVWFAMSWSAWWCSNVCLEYSFGEQQRWCPAIDVISDFQATSEGKTVTVTEVVETIKYVYYTTEAVSVSLRFRAYALGTFVADVIGTDTYHIVMTYT